jgi:NAD(P)-dependent dehydrogenase (short-subunit alcohol dehydrogenase family)
MMNKVWLITGANSGFGRAITEAAAAAGDIAVATARRVASLDDVVGAHPGQVDALPLDVTDPGSVDAAVRDVIGRHGRGIKVVIVEPGAFRTGLFGSHSASAPITDYAGTVGQTRRMIETAAGTQPGDPAKAAAAILTVLDAPSPPLRLPLGDDAVDAIVGHLDSTRADISTWEKLARDTRLPG